MLNPILNSKTSAVAVFARFRQAGLQLITHAKMQRAVSTFLGEPGKLVQSMYFDGHPVTWPHQDTYYLDAEEIGRMTPAWVAVEDIVPDGSLSTPKSQLSWRLEIGRLPAEAVMLLVFCSVGDSVPLIGLTYPRFKVDTRAPAERGQFGDIEKLARGSIRL